MAYYDGRIKVVCVDRMCFPVDPVTLDPVGGGCYDAYPHLPEPGAVDVISHGEWIKRRADQFDQEKRDYYRRSSLTHQR